MFYIYLPGRYSLPHCKRGSQRMTFRTFRNCFFFSPSTLWVPGVELRSSGLATSAFTPWTVSLAPALFGVKKNPQSLRRLNILIFLMIHMYVYLTFDSIWRKLTFPSLTSSHSVWWIQLRVELIKIYWYLSFHRITSPLCSAWRF